MPTTADAQYYDYVSEGLIDPHLSQFFPNMEAANRDMNGWEYLRREIPHIWRADRRSPVMGFLSLDEATLLYNLALPFAGERALEIGCWRGWSTAHIAKAGVVLDVIDPVLRDAAVQAEIAATLDAIGAQGRYRLHDAESPAGLYAAKAGEAAPWRFVFIDGNHEPDGPVLDAANVVEMVAEDAVIVFHDLASPHVAAGLDLLRERGWSTLIYQTMQIVGVAWRGKVTLPEHRPDPRVRWSIPDHLAHYPFCGEPDGERLARYERVLARQAALARDLAAARLGFAKLASEAVVPRPPTPGIGSRLERLVRAVPSLVARGFPMRVRS